MGSASEGDFQVFDYKSLPFGAFAPLAHMSFFFATPLWGGAPFGGTARFWRSGLFLGLLVFGVVLGEEGLDGGADLHVVVLAQVGEGGAH